MFNKKLMNFYNFLKKFKVLIIQGTHKGGIPIYNGSPKPVTPENIQYIEEEIIAIKMKYSLKTMENHEKFNSFYKPRDLFL